MEHEKQQDEPLSQAKDTLNRWRSTLSTFAPQYWGERFDQARSNSGEFSKNMFTLAFIAWAVRPVVALVSDGVISAGGFVKRLVTGNKEKEEEHEEEAQPKKKGILHWLRDQAVASTAIFGATFASVWMLEFVRAKPGLKEKAIKQIDDIQAFIHEELPNAFLESPEWQKGKQRGDNAKTYLEAQKSEALSPTAIADAVNKAMDAGSIMEYLGSQNYEALVYMAALMDYARHQLSSKTYGLESGCLPKSYTQLARMIDEIHVKMVDYRDQRSKICCGESDRAIVEDTKTEEARETTKDLAMLTQDIVRVTGHYIPLELSDQRALSVSCIKEQLQDHIQRFIDNVGLREMVEKR